MTDPHIAALQQLPVFQLAYPGAELLRQGALPPSQGMDGPQGAVVSKLFGMANPAPEGVNGRVILAWYHRQLQAQGWTLNPRGPATTFEAQEIWVKGQQYYASIGIYLRDVLPRYEPSVDPTKYGIVFLVTLGELGYQGE